MGFLPSFLSEAFGVHQLELGIFLTKSVCSDVEANVRLVVWLRRGRPMDEALFVVTNTEHKGVGLV